MTPFAAATGRHARPSRLAALTRAIVRLRPTPKTDTPEVNR